MLSKLKNWVKKQNEVTKERMNNQMQKQDNKAEEKLKTMLDSTGFKRANAKGKFIGVNSASHTYPAHSVDYVGGYYPHPDGKEDIKAILIPQGILLSHLLDNDIIPYSEIESINYKTWEQISRDVTLTRLVAFGVYAFAMKKQRKTINKCVVLNCKHEGMKYAVVFAGTGASTLYSNLFNIVSAVKEG